MNSIEEAKKLLVECETGLKAILAQVANDGDYDAVIQITSLAKSVSKLEANLQTNPSGDLVKSSLRDSGQSVRVDKFSTNGGNTEAKSETSKRRKTRKKVATPNGDYPKFFRRGEDIVKIGWSKREKREYQHKSPGKYLSVVASAISQAGENGSIIATQEIFPVADPDSGDEIPAYQAYLCLALLREAGMVVQEGRQGHRVAVDGSLDSQVLLTWESLPKM